jgi:hypothetical protein
MRRAPWLLLALVVAIDLFSIVLYLLGAASGEAFLTLPLLGYAIVGALAGSRDPRNAIAWVFLALALVTAIAVFCEAYTIAAEGDAASLTGGVVAAWFSSWAQYVWLALGAIFVPLLFPDGRLPSRRWRALIFLAIAAVALSASRTALTPGQVDSPETRAPNPLGIGGAERALDVAEAVGTGLGGICIVAAGVSLLVRLRRARGARRQQLKWFVFVAGLMVVAVLIAGISTVAETEVTNRIGAVGWYSWLFFLLFGVPATLAIAIFRYRLYDVDVVINRTLVYGLLTALLAGAYFGFVLFFQLALNPLTEENELAVAASTLAVAALFRPGRRRIQALVDRRFYRRKYDATQALAVFSARLREEIDLDALRVELTGAVRETMQPRHISLWLREAGR